ncbi:unnamed protein product [Triticum turgidum subsp. durum]|uniref:Gnk2-homologous domain-containing protein n=1 Tax=Triticum turgidum subsp. durum TaxID=4567 RepID=A0A9R0W6B4_TRITD|nr:unnamed protein product [Triticum turgidum subsp. durum]
MIIVLLLILGFEPFVATGDPLAQLCGGAYSNMNGSTYNANLELLSTMLSKSASSKQTLLAKGFVGTDQDRTYGVALCRGDSMAPACSRCITTAFLDAQRVCVVFEDTHVLYENCIVHISPKDLIYDSAVVLNGLLIFSGNSRTTDPGVSIEVGSKYTNVSIDGNIKLLLQETAKQAAYNSATRYATGCMDVNGTDPLLYSLAQCNQNLSPNDCWDCLDNIRSAVQSFFYRQRGEWIAGMWCNFRYDPYQFYKGEPMKQIAWSASVDPATNMVVARQPAPGPVGVPRQKDENKPVVVPSRKHKSKQESRFFLSQN